MRKDITADNLLKGGVKINKSALARQYGCCWRTIDRRLNPEKYKMSKKTRVYTSILDGYKSIIDKVLENNNAPATGIYCLLKLKYNYTGSYSTVKKYVSKKKKKIIDNLTIRFNTIMGYQSQVDWKESMILHTTDNNKITFNIFLIVLGCSRMKYIELTENREQKTLFRCLNNAFNYFGGVTEEIIFDNMKTVVDQAKSDFKKVIINNKMSYYAKDVGFIIYTCRPYRPMTKGKVETLAKIMNRLKAFDYQIKDWNDLKIIVNKILHSLNYEEISQATNKIPITDFVKEKEYLIPVNLDLLMQYTNNRPKYKVTKESMINYKGKKYSVPINYVGKTLQVNEDDEFIYIYSNTILVRKYSKNNDTHYNYKLEDYKDILEHSSISEQAKNRLKNNINKDLRSLNDIKIEEE